MFSQKMPWDGMKDTAVIARVMQGARPATRPELGDCSEVEMSEEAWQLVESCWKVDANLRPDLLYIHHVLTTLKEVHDMSVTSNTIISLSPEGDDPSMESASKTSSAPTLFVSHTSPSPNLFSQTLSNPQHVASLRHRLRTPMSLRPLVEKLSVLSSVAGAVPVLGASVTACVEALKLIFQYTEVSHQNRPS
jgi:hypothetical protein